MWQQGNRDQALDWLANLDTRQQQALQRAMSTHQALGPIYNAAARVQQVSVQTAQRLSEGAQSLASQTAQFGRDTAARAGQTWDNTVDRVADFGQRAQVQADLATQVANERVNAAGRAIAQGAQTTGQAIATGAQATGRAIATGAQATGQAAVAGAQATGRAVATGAQATGQAVAAGGRAVADAGREAAGMVSRWVQDRRSNASNRANAARAAFSAFRQDPNLGSSMSGQDIQALSARAQAVTLAQDPAARDAAVNDLVQAVNNLKTSNYQYPQQVPGPHSAGRDSGNLAQFVSAGQAPASQIPAQYGPQGTAGQGQQQEGTQGEAQRTGGQTPGQNQKGPDLTK
jgi:hypothetical protein